MAKDHKIQPQKIQQEKRSIRGRHSKDPVGGNKHHVVCKSGRFDCIHVTIDDCKWTSQGNMPYYQNNRTIVELHGIKPRCNSTISSVGYDPQHSFGCFIPVSKELKEQSMWPLLSWVGVKRWRSSQTECSNLHTLDHPQICSSINNGSGNRGNMCTRRTNHQLDIRRTWPPTTSNTHSLRQCNISGHSKWYSQNTTIQR